MIEKLRRRSQRGREFNEYRVKQMEARVFEFNEKFAGMKNNFFGDKNELPAQSKNFF